jgi:Leucine-rich repeat (LRR) protein
LLLSIGLSNQSFYLSCKIYKVATRVECDEAYLTNKTDFELVLSPKNTSGKDITTISVSALFSPAKAKNNLTRFPVEWVEFFPKLSILQIFYYTMDSIVFDDSMAKLDQLYVTDNKLKLFETTLTAENAEISFLTITNNQLAKIDKDLFKGMNDMIALNLYGNKITSIHLESFAHMKKLEKINLNSNPLKSLPLEFYQSFPANMNQILLGSTGISEIPNGAFKNFNNLTGLSLYKNKLETFIARDVELSFCKLLDLGENMIKQVNFEGLKGLEELKLDYNMLTTFNATEVGLTSCEDLNIKKNNLTDFNLSNVEKLEEVYMESNKLTTIAADMFPEEANLTKLYVSRNQITSIDKNVIDLLAKPDLFGFYFNPCVKDEIINKTKIYYLKQCYKNFEKEKAMKKLTMMED